MHAMRSPQLRWQKSEEKGGLCVDLVLRSRCKEDCACRRRNEKRVVHSIKSSRVREEVASHVGVPCKVVLLKSY